jgi:hypothetical protein
MQEVAAVVTELDSQELQVLDRTRVQVLTEFIIRHSPDTIQEALA